MSVTDDVRADGRALGPPAGPPPVRDGQFDRTPPQDIAAEQCVLGGMLLSKDAIADVVEILKPGDFYRPVHATIFDAILDLYGRGEPADPITVAAALADSGDLGRVGGAPYLHTLIASVPTAANAAYYARIVGERAVLRRLVEAGTRIVQLGYGSAGGGGRDVDDVVDLAQQAVYDVTERRVSEDFAVLADMLQPTLDEIEAVGAQGGVMTGVPTGFTDLDRLLNGLHPGQLIIVAGRPGLGKALALDTPLPTPDGWTTMGEVAVGDRLIGADGRPTTVTAAFAVLRDRPCYEVEFSDGSVIVADAGHLWRTTGGPDRHRRVGGARQFSRRNWRRRELPGGRRELPGGDSVTRVSLDPPRAGSVSLNGGAPEPAAAGDQVITPALASRAPRAPGPATRYTWVGRKPAARRYRALGGSSEVSPGSKDRSAVPYPRRALFVAWLRRAHRNTAGRRALTGEVLTTAQIAETLGRDDAGRGRRHAVRNTRPLLLPDRRLPVAPYPLGVWLGAVPSATLDTGTVEELRRDGYELAPGGPAGPPVLRHLADGPVDGLPPVSGLPPGRHIPGKYLRAAEWQRRDLLAGLLDAGGTVTPDGQVRYATTSRQLLDGVRELVHSLGHQCVVNPGPVVGPSGPPLPGWVLTLVPTDEVFRAAGKRRIQRERCRPTTDRRARYIVDVRPTSSVPVRCVTVDNADHLYLAGRSMIPTHNSTASMDFARNAAIRHNCASAIFSLEMSKVEIVMRLLSAEARVPLHVLRSGQLSDDDWTKLARRMGEISEAPLFVDDTPNMNLMEIRAKARRLKQRHDLKMIVVDYLQLMSSPKRTESRQQEVAELSRGLKLLAKEVECPVIAVSQLNRGPEQRTDKRPQLSDLRESGCLTAGTRVIRADTNVEVSLGDLISEGARDIPVWSLDDRLMYTPRTMTHVFPSGNREVFRMTLASGREIEATANHPFLTFGGWIPLAELTVGSRIAAPRHVPAPLNVHPWPEAEVVMLAHLLGGGSFPRRQPIRYASRDEWNLAAVTGAARHFGITPVRDEFAAAKVTAGLGCDRGPVTLRLPGPDRLARGRRNPLAEWLDGLGLFGLRPPERFIPPGVFALPKAQVSHFLRHLWATDGSVTIGRSGRGGRVYLASTSRRMLEDVARLLLRYGITGRLGGGAVVDHRPSYTLDVSGRDDQLRFLREIGVHGEGADASARLLAVLDESTSNTNVDTIPGDVWLRVREILTEQNTSHRNGAAFTGTRPRAGSLSGRAPSPGGRLAKIARVLDAVDLDLHATNDICWDEVTSIESLGQQDVYDATVLGTHNFIANGIAVHNSIEQDADVVILLHRDDYYDKESPRAGEADFIVAKHRNGPTDTVTVAAQLHLSRFMDMAIV